MDLNSIVFPAPESSYDLLTFPGELIWLPKLCSPQEKPIPCLFLQYLLGSSKVLIFYHGNAEDTGLAYDLCSHLRDYLKLHVLIVEYPGYGMYSGHTSASSICDSIIAYLVDKMEWKLSNIFVFGRSIGSGPACYLASKYQLGCLVLMSAYTSIRSVVKHIAGRLAQYFISQRFNNIDLIPHVTCPTFFLHGQKDTLIPMAESQALHARCTGISFIHMPAEMDHNEFEYAEDLIFPLSEFLRKCHISVEPLRGERSFLMFPEELFDLPEGYEQPLPQGRINRLLRKMNGS